MSFEVSRSALTLVALAASLHAQWTEWGDAGQTSPTAQTPLGYSVSALTSITGTLTTNDVDMYLIDVVDPAAFTASTIGGATVDTQLFLFTLDGQGVTHDDDASGTVQSTLTGAFVPCPGTYLLAISAYNVDPFASGQLLWNNAPFDVERRPDGPRRTEAVNSWLGTGNTSGSYVITLTGVTFYGKELVCPSNHYLSENATQGGSAGSYYWWNDAGGRFQVLYEGSNFVSAGALTGIWLDRLMFRGEDGNPNLGGQLWANVLVQIGNTTLTSTTIGTDFAANLATTVGLQSHTFPTVAVARSVGSTPNNYNISLDLLGGMGGHYIDPTAQNLLIDITLPTAAFHTGTSGAMMPIQDTTGGTAVVHGSGLFATNPTATNGSYSTAPPICGFKVDGSAGWRPVHVARNEYYGAGCGGSAASFYQAFLTGQAFDVTGLVMTPDAYPNPHSYTVTSGAAAFDATKVNATPNSTGDDSVVSFALGFTFAYPGGSTTNISVATNGYTTLSATGGSDYSPTVAEFLGGGGNLARFAPYWCDLHAGRNTATNPNAGLHVLVDNSGGVGNAVCYATWYDVGAFQTEGGSAVAGHAVYDFQLVLREATGVVEFRYGSMPAFAEGTASDNPGYPAIVGFSRGMVGGMTAADPGSRDLSLELPFATAIEGPKANMVQHVVATPNGGGMAYGGRAYVGQTLTFDADNIPAGSVLGVQLIDFAATRPGLYLPGITAPGCLFSVTGNALIHQVALLPGASFVGTVPITIPTGVEGAELFAQFVVLDGLFGAPDIITAASNAVRVTVGLD